jgi:hypothetical protein
MNLTKTLKFLLLTASSLSITMPERTIGAEREGVPGSAFILSKTPIVQTVAPEQSLGAAIMSELPSHLGHEAWKECAAFSRMGVKLYKEGWESLIGETLEAFINSVNSRYLTKYIKSPEKSSSQAQGRDLKLEEFNEEALCPLIAELRQSMASLIHYFCMRGSLVGYDANTHKKVHSYLDMSVYRFLAQKFIPDFVPFKNIFIALTDFQPIKYYLDYQLDMMIVKSILSLYHKTTGKTFKRSAEDLVRHMMGRIPPIDPMSQEQPEPELSHLGQNGPSLPGQESFQEEPIAQGLDVDDRSTIHPIGPIHTEEEEESEIDTRSRYTRYIGKRAELNPLKMGIDSLDSLYARPFPEDSYSQLWIYFRPHFQHFIRAAFNNILKPISTAVLKETSKTVLRGFLENKFVINTVKMMGGGAGLAVTYLTAGQNFLVLLPASFAGASCFGWVAAKSSAFAFDKTTTRLKDNLSALMDGYSYHLVPLTREEHILYHLNPTPTQEEKLIYAADYQLRERLSQKTFLGELIRDVIRAGGGIGQYLYGLPFRMSQYVLSFLKYSQASSESTQTILTVLDRQEGQKDGFLEESKKNNVSGSVFLGGIIDKKRQGVSLTSYEAQVWNNIIDYPSFEIQQQKNQLIELWQKASQEGEQTLTEALKQIKAHAVADQQELLMTYRRYDKLPSEFASLYQQIQGERPWEERFELDFIEVEEIIGGSVLRCLDDFTAHERELFDQAIQNENFLKNYIEHFILSYSLTEKNARNQANIAKAIMEDPALLKHVPSAYARQRQQAYIREHNEELNLLRDSMLAQGLSFADILDLHQHMTDEQRAQYIKRKPQKLTREVLQPEFDLIRQILSEVIKANHPNFIKFYSDAFTSQYNLRQFVVEAFNQNRSLEKCPEQVEETLPSLADQLMTQLQQDPFFQAFREQLQGVLKNGKLRTQVYQHIAYQIRQEILKKWGLDVSDQEEWIFLEAPQDRNQVDNLLGKEPLQSSLLFNDSSALKNSPELLDLLRKTEEIPSHFYQKPADPVFNLRGCALKTTNQTNFTAYQLCDLVNRLVAAGRIQDMSQLSFDENVTIIHQAIQEQKRCCLGEMNDVEALTFAEENLAALLDFKNQLVEGQLDSTDRGPKYAHSLFYSYEELYDLFRERRHQLIEQIKKQPHRAL